MFDQINKPIVEKIRRDKINGYLDELKRIILKSSPNSLPQSSPSSISNVSVCGSDLGKYSTELEPKNY